VPSGSADLPAAAPRGRRPTSSARRPSGRALRPAGVTSSRLWARSELLPRRRDLTGPRAPGRAEVPPHPALFSISRLRSPAIIERGVHFYPPRRGVSVLRSSRPRARARRTLPKRDRTRTEADFPWCRGGSPSRRPPWGAELGVLSQRRKRRARLRVPYGFLFASTGGQTPVPPSSAGSGLCRATRRDGGSCCSASRCFIRRGRFRGERGVLSASARRSAATLPCHRRQRSSCCITGNEGERRAGGEAAFWVDFTVFCAAESRPRLGEGGGIGNRSRAPGSRRLCAPASPPGRRRALRRGEMGSFGSSSIGFSRFYPACRGPV